MDEEEYKIVYAKYRDELLKRQLSNTENFDKAILTLSSAVLGFSLTFIKNVVSLDAATFIWILITAWIFLVIAVLSTTGSYLSSQASISRQLAYAENYYLKGQEEYLSKKNYFASLTRWAAYISAFSFTVGVILLTVFVSFNIICL